MKKIPLLLPIVLFLSINACKTEDECPNETRIAEDLLSEEALSYNPYSPSTLTAIFTDEDGSEFDFLIERTEIQTSLNHVSGFCYEGSFLKIYLRGNDLNQYFHIWINDVPKPNSDNASGEELLVLESKREDTMTGVNIDQTCLIHSINIQKETGEDLFTDYSVLEDSVILNDQVYYDVLKNNKVDLTPSVEVFYNKDQGLVGFTDLDTGKTYNLDRID